MCRSHTGRHFFFGCTDDENMDPNKKVTHENEKASTAEKVTGVTTEIYFEGGPPMSREMRTSVARLQLGPPAKARDHPHLGCCWQAGLQNNGNLRCTSMWIMPSNVQVSQADSFINSIDSQVLRSIWRPLTVRYHFHQIAYR